MLVSRFKRINKNALVVSIIIVVSAAVLVIGAYYLKNNVFDNAQNEEYVPTAEDIEADQIAQAQLAIRENQTYEEVLTETGTDQDIVGFKSNEAAQLVRSQQYDEFFRYLEENNLEAASEPYQEIHFAVLSYKATAYASQGNTASYVGTLERIVELDYIKNNQEWLDIWNKNLDNARNGQLPQLIQPEEVNE